MVTHILRSDTDPIVLARLRAVNRAMRDAVDATGLRVKEWTPEEAAERGCLDTLKHKLQTGRLNECTVYESSVCEYAAKEGQLEVLQWAHANGCPWNEMTCAFAAGKGKLEAIQWLHANGCPWAESTCQWAADGGHLEVLQWLRTNGCPWNEETCSNAAFCGQLGVLQWAHANGCPWDWQHCVSRCKFGADSESDHLDVLAWLNENKPMAPP